MGTCVDEIKNAKIGDGVRVSVWATEKPINLYSVIVSENSANKEKKLYSLWAKLFSNQGNGYYRQSSLISKWLFEQKYFDDNLIDGILYPSAIGNNNQAQNFAIRTSYIDDGSLKLVSCDYYQINSITNDSYGLTKKFNGEIESSTSKISWVEEPPTSAILPPQQCVKFTATEQGWVPDNPNIEIINPVAIAPRKLI